MEILKNYVDAMFKEFPNNTETAELKTRILDSMEAKFQDLLEDGKNESEALGTVIAQFGDIEELKEAYEVPVEEKEEDFEFVEEKSERLFAVTMPLSIAAFLIIGFVWGYWFWALIPITALVSVSLTQRDSIFSVTMPLAIAIFLALGQWFGLWHPAWIIIPTTALITTAISALFGGKV